MPERRTSSVRSIVEGLHFSGKVIMASILFGFGLMLVGAILLIISTGGQKRPPLQESEEVKKSPMTYVGPGVLGVGGFFVVVGTVMCLFETRILRRRKNTDHANLLNSEIVQTRSTDPSSTERQDDVYDGRGEGDNGLEKTEETQIKTVYVDHGNQRSVENTEKTLVGSGASEEGVDKDLSMSPQGEQMTAFNASIYVDAVSGNDNDYDENEERFIAGSLEFSTPPESQLEAVSKMSFDGQSGEGNNHSKNRDDASTTDVATESAKDSSLPLFVEKESPSPTENDSNQIGISTQLSEKEIDLRKEPLQLVTNPDSQVKEAHIKNTDNKEQQRENGQTISSLDAEGKNIAGSSSDKPAPPSTGNMDS